MRIQLEFPEDKVRELKVLMEKTGLKTYHDVFNNALTLLKWSIQETERGRVILSHDDRTQKSRELVMPFLQSIAQTKMQAQHSSERDEEQHEALTHQ